MLELRKHKRFEMSGVRNYFPSVSGVSVLNLSMGGIAVQVDEVLNPGSEYSLKIRGGENPVPVRGNIVWSIMNTASRRKRMPKYMAGLKFAHGGAESLRAIYFILSVLGEFINENNSFVFETLKKVKMIGACSDEGQEVLFAVKSKLLLYLKRSDEEVYPVLRSIAEYFMGLRKPLGLFEEEIKEATDVANRFYGKYSRGDSGSELVADFGQLFMALATRIAIEENLIFCGYENSFENQGANEAPGRT